VRYVTLGAGIGLIIGLAISAGLADFLGYWFPSAWSQSRIFYIVVPTIIGASLGALYRKG